MSGIEIPSFLHLPKQKTITTSVQKMVGQYWTLVHPIAIILPVTGLEPDKGCSIYNWSIKCLFSTNHSWFRHILCPVMCIFCYHFTAFRLSALTLKQSCTIILWSQCFGGSVGISPLPQTLSTNVIASHSSTNVWKKLITNFTNL